MAASVILYARPKLDRWFLGKIEEEMEAQLRTLKRYSLLTGENDAVVTELAGLVKGVVSSMVVLFLLICLWG